jgi:hypothetical protein
MKEVMRVFSSLVDDLLSFPKCNIKERTEQNRTNISLEQSFTIDGSRISSS